MRAQHIETTPLHTVAYLNGLGLIKEKSGQKPDRRKGRGQQGRTGREDLEEGKELWEKSWIRQVRQYFLQQSQTFLCFGCASLYMGTAYVEYIYRALSLG